MNQHNGSNHEWKQGFWGNLYELPVHSILKRLSKTATSVLDPLKLNAIIERSRRGQRVFVKERHLHSEGMADLANVYFHTLRIPIRFLNNVTAWQLWELKCFNMLNGDH